MFMHEPSHFSKTPLAPYNQGCQFTQIFLSSLSFLSFTQSTEKNIVQTQAIISKYT